MFSFFLSPFYCFLLLFLRIPIIILIIIIINIRELLHHHNWWNIFSRMIENGSKICSQILNCISNEYICHCYNIVIHCYYYWYSHQHCIKTESIWQFHVEWKFSIFCIQFGFINAIYPRQWAIYYFAQFSFLSGPLCDAVCHRSTTELARKFTLSQKCVQN